MLINRDVWFFLGIVVWMQFFSLTCKRVRLLLWGELFHCSILVWRGGLKILPCDPNKTQSSPDIVALSSTIQVLGQCISLRTCLCRGKCRDAHCHSSLEMCVLSWKAERILIKALLLRVIIFCLLGVCAQYSTVPLQALHSNPVLWDTDSVPGCVQIQDTLISAGLCCIHTFQSSQRPGKSHWSHWSWSRVGTQAVGVGEPGQGCPPCKVPLLACVQLTAVLCYKVDWFFNSLKDIWGTTLVIVTPTT